MIYLGNPGKSRYFRGFHAIQVGALHDLVIFIGNTVGYTYLVW